MRTRTPKLFLGHLSRVAPSLRPGSPAPSPVNRSAPARPRSAGASTRRRLTAGVAGEGFVKIGHAAGEVSAETSAVQFRPPQFGSRSGFYEVRSRAPTNFNPRRARGCRMPAILVAKSEMLLPPFPFGRSLSKIGVGESINRGIVSLKDLRNRCLEVLAKPLKGGDGDLTGLFGAPTEASERVFKSSFEKFSDQWIPVFLTAGAVPANVSRR